MIKKLNLSFGNNFINKSEKKYLDASIQKPVSRQFLEKNSIVSNSDIEFKRTEQNGLDFCKNTKFKETTLYFVKIKITK